MIDRDMSDRPKKTCSPDSHVTVKNRCYPNVRAQRKGGLIGSWVSFKYEETDMSISDSPGYVVATRKIEPGVLLVELDWENRFEPKFVDVSSASVVGPATKYVDTDLPDSVQELADIIGKMNEMVVDMSYYDNLPTIRRHWLSGESLRDIERRR